VSNQLTSPKFYNDNSLLDYCKEKLSFNDSKAKDEKIINQTINDSISLAVGQSKLISNLVESFEEKKNIIIRDEENVESNNNHTVKHNNSNRNAPNGMKLNLDLNDNPTLSLKNETSFTNNGSTGPVILSPIVSSF